MSESPARSRSVTCHQCGAPLALPDYADLAVCPFCGSSLRADSVEPRVAGDAGTQGGDGPGTPGAGGAGAQPGGHLAGTDGAVEQALRSLTCPQCAGPLSVRAGRRILLCSHCGVRVLVCGQGGLSRWLFPQTVDHLGALHTAAGWLTDYPGVARAAREAPVRQAQLVHVPIWEHKALVAGWEFGTKLRTKSYLVEDNEGNEKLELALAEERFEDPHLQERRYFQAACDLAALGATRPRFSGRELLLPLAAGEFDPASQVMEPQGTAAAVAEQGRRLALQPASGAADPRTWMLILRESVTLLYYPLWLIDYQAGGRSYRVVVDAHDGGVNSATAPAREGRFTPGLGVKVATLLLVAVLALWLGSAWSGARVVSIFLAVIVCIAAILLVFRSPAGGKVEYHEPFSS
jgi:hypothetical protein